MATKKSQHYVPKGYFRNFSKDAKNIHIYNLKDKKSYCGPFKTQCCKPYFYSKDTNIEDSFGKLEAKQLASLSKLKSVKTLDEISKQEWLNIFTFLNFQKIRTNLSKEKSEELEVFLSDNIFKPMLTSDQKAIKMGLSEDDLDGFVIRRKGFFLQQINVMLEASWLLCDLERVIIHNKTVNPFIFSDVPVIFYNRLFHGHKDFGHIGVQSTGLLVICPISDDKILYLYDKDRYSLESVKNGNLYLNSKSDVEKFNKLQFYAGASVCYSGKKRGVKNAKKIHSKISSTNSPLIGTGKKKFVRQKDNLEEHVEQFHFYEPNINIGLDFSFQTLKPIIGAVPIIRNIELYNLHAKDAN